MRQLPTVASLLPLAPHFDVGRNDNEENSNKLGKLHGEAIFNYELLAIFVVGDSDPEVAARLISASRGLNEDDDGSAVKILFHVCETEGLAVLVPPPDLGPTSAFKLQSLGRQNAQQADPSRQIPPELLQRVEEYHGQGRTIVCLWSDGKCWAGDDSHRALGVEHFPFPSLTEMVTLK